MVPPTRLLRDYDGSQVQQQQQLSRRRYCRAAVALAAFRQRRLLVNTTLPLVRLPGKGFRDVLSGGGRRLGCLTSRCAFTLWVLSGLCYFPHKQIS